MTTKSSFPYIRFSQYGSETPADDLLLFAAPARTLMQWAGIPRKAWQIRMLFQRPITAAREVELKRFWETASSNDPTFILGPTAIVLALEGEPTTADGHICLEFQPIVNLEDDATHNLTVLTDALLPKILVRLSPEQRLIAEAFSQDPFGPFPEIEHDYVFEFALQLFQMRKDAQQFVALNSLSEDQVTEIILSMESLCRPAIVVDGQHRLWGAASAEAAVMLPVVAIPNCKWTEQIYQFVVINETAQKVETSLLTDIFGSSLTRAEQTAVRQSLSKTRVDVEGRIAAVIASRDQDSPFYNVVQLKIAGETPPDFKPYLSERTIRVLIDGSSQRYSRGWRSDDEFYEKFVAPTFPIRGDWDSWTDGNWRDYWKAFWLTVRDYYNEQSIKLGKLPLWSNSTQTNLTKAVTLRQLQTLFMVKCIDRMNEIDSTTEILRETLGEDEAAEKISHLRKARAIPDTLDQFRLFVTDFFLERGIPVRVFLTDWKTSLDDAQGQLDLWETLETAFDRTRRGERFVVKGRIFEPSENG